MNKASVWVDTDFGFDDLWALLLLRYLGIDAAGVSLVCGNSPLQQVVSNAYSAEQVFGFKWPLFSGAESPLRQPLQTAETVLGPTGMRSRGKALPLIDVSPAPYAAQSALIQWLDSDPVDSAHHRVLALGPLTNLATLCINTPDAFSKIKRIVWMGGSAGRGNQTSHAEFNAYADPDALEVVLSSGVSVDIVDLELCRQVAFGEQHIPVFNTGQLYPGQETAILLSDLLGGYLDIALSRGRTSMNIYDPMAVIALANTSSIEFNDVAVEVNTSSGEERGRTLFSSSLSSGDVSIGSSNTVSDTSPSPIRIATGIDAEAARALCMEALTCDT